MTGVSRDAVAVAKGLRITDINGANRRASAMAPLQVASGPTDGVTPPSTATAATRSRSAGMPAHASAYGPPPDRPTTPSFSAPSTSATWAMSAAQSPMRS